MDEAQQNWSIREAHATQIAEELTSIEVHFDERQDGHTGDFGAATLGEIEEMALEDPSSLSTDDGAILWEAYQGNHHFLFSGIPFQEIASRIELEDDELIAEFEDCDRVTDEIRENYARKRIEAIFDEGLAGDNSCPCFAAVRIVDNSNRKAILVWEAYGSGWEARFEFFGAFPSEENFIKAVQADYLIGPEYLPDGSLLPWIRRKN